MRLMDWLLGGSLRDRVAALEAKAVADADELRSRDVRIRTLTRDLADAGRRADGVSDVLRLMSQDVAGRQLGWKELREAVQKLKQAVAEKDARIADAHKDAADIRRQFDHLSARLGREQRVAEERQRDLNDLRGTLRELQAAVCVTDDQLRPVHEGDRAGFVAAVKRLSRVWAEKSEEAARLRDRLADAEGRAAAYLAAADALRAGKVESDDLIRNLRGEAEGWAEVARRVEAERDKEADRVRALAEGVRGLAEAYLGPPAGGDEPTVVDERPVAGLSADALSVYGSAAENARRQAVADSLQGEFARAFVGESPPVYALAGESGVAVIEGSE